ncbi:tetratricopeptide repeat protein [uncultured Thiothrix sp.]|uniref:YfgM family protein n=1 Tax=uncultured Thiothrix sp. TaxID=223185 RepID=UPI00261F6B9B|nr:tetratricopeptide repeat protein [uncultured Thiothrix sp.]
MIDYNKTDDEQAEDLKAWWKENGLSVVAGIALAIAALFAWEYWQKYQIKTMEGASTLYSTLQTTADDAVAAKAIQELQTEYPKSPYAALASLETAKKHAEKGEYEPAITALRWAIDHTKDVDLKNVASVRLARVLASAGKYDEALKLASQSYSASYESILEEIKGDIYSAQKKTEDARKAYERAILAAKNNSSELIKIKLDNLGKGA